MLFFLSDIFIEEWLVGMKKNGIKPSVFPTDIDTAVVDVDVLLKDLKVELEKY